MTAASVLGGEHKLQSTPTGRPTPERTQWRFDARTYTPAHARRRTHIHARTYTPVHSLTHHLPERPHPPTHTHHTRRSCTLEKMFNKKKQFVYRATAACESCLSPLPRLPTLTWSRTEACSTSTLLPLPRPCAACASSTRIACCGCALLRVRIETMTVKPPPVGPVKGKT